MGNTSGPGVATGSMSISNGAFQARANISKINAVFNLVAGMPEILSHNDKPPSAN